MPKLKSKRGAKKRFKVTGSGKVKASRPFRRHILTSKAHKRKRQLRNDLMLSPSDTKRMLVVLLGE
jgi:large subunit ribosomal protein L35